jgi:hypothetical protein
MVKDLMGHRAGSQGTTTLSDGSTVDMPLLSYRASAFGAFFSISAAKARALLPTDDLRPVLLSPRRALVMVQVMKYTEKTIDPYEEFIVSIPVHRSQRADLLLVSAALWQKLRGSGAYITHIAVDDDASRLAGREILGLPKVLAQFEVTETATERIADVTADGQSVFTLAVKRPKKPASPKPRSFYCYSLSPEEGTLFHIPYTSEMDTAMAWGSRAARLHLGSHTIADELRDLDISSAPVLSLDIPQYSLVSNRPEKKVDVGGWQDPRGFYCALRTQAGKTQQPLDAHVDVRA